MSWRKKTTEDRTLGQSSCWRGGRLDTPREWDRDTSSSSYLTNNPDPGASMITLNQCFRGKPLPTLRYDEILELS